LEEVGAVEPPPGFGQGGEREAVPRSNRLVVARGLGPLLADLPKPPPQLLVELPPDDEATVLERLE
jgi:hypothetical protein